jgi:hypothetical protein
MRTIRVPKAVSSSQRFYQSFDPTHYQAIIGKGKDKKLLVDGGV